MKLLPWLVIVALCLAAILAETAGQESLTEIHTVVANQGDQLRRARRDDGGNGGNDSQLMKMAQNLKKEMMQIVPVVRRFISSMEQCGLLPPGMMQLVRMADMFLKIAQSTGYLD